NATFTYARSIRCSRSNGGMPGREHSSPRPPRMSRRMPHPHKKRRRLFQRRRVEPGTPPGTMVVPPGAQPPVMTLFAYEQDRCLEVQPKTAAEVAQFREKHPVIWLNVDGLGDLGLLQELARLFHLHPLA